MHRSKCTIGLQVAANGFERFRAGFYAPLPVGCRPPSTQARARAHASDALLGVVRGRWPPQREERRKLPQTARLAAA
eukprot:11697518-Alexandrium_andersonii.AAC.1